MISITASNVTIMVASMDKTISFYESIGLKLKQRWDDHYAMVETAGITIGIHPGGNEDPSLIESHVSIGFMINDIREARSLLEKNKISYKVDDGKSGNYLHFKDPDGTLLYFVQPGW